MLPLARISSSDISLINLWKTLLENAKTRRQYVPLHFLTRFILLGISSLVIGERAIERAHKQISSSLSVRPSVCVSVCQIAQSLHHHLLLLRHGVSVEATRCAAHRHLRCAGPSSSRVLMDWIKDFATDRDHASSRVLCHQQLQVFFFLRILHSCDNSSHL